MNGLKKHLVELKHKSTILTYVWFLSRQPIFAIREKRIKKNVQNRSAGYEEQRYLPIKAYKNKHLGERCFIVATGPSLTMEDLELIKNEYSFGMNSIPKIFPRTIWRPTYFGIQDCNVYEKMQSTICDSYKSADNVFVSDSIADKFPIPENFMQFPYDAVYHDNYLEVDKYFAKFSDDCYAIVYDGYSITYSLIQIAVYMGFKEIYLLGADCSYKRGARNHVADSGNDDKNEEKNHDKMIVGYQKAKEYAELHGIKIINCTRGGMLEVYPRMQLEDVLKEKN